MAISNLGPRIRDLVLAVNQDPPSSPVSDWIARIAQGDITKESNLKDLESILTPLTYLVDNEFTVADVALYAALHPVLSTLPAAKYHSFPSVTRYFNHIQHTPPVRRVALASLPIVSFDFQNAPKAERKSEPPKKKVKKDAIVSNLKAEPNPPVKGVEIATEPDPTAKKEKKTKSKKESGTADSSQKAGNIETSPSTNESAEHIPSMIDLRVGHIVDIKKHPDADGLYIEQIDLGEETGPRTVVSGLVNYIPIEDMRDKFLVAVCNLKPASMRGVKSFAMVLCATSKDGKESGIELIAPPAGSKPGDRVYFEGPKFEFGEPLPQLNPKKKIFEAIQPGLTTLPSREAAWIDPITGTAHRIRTKAGSALEYTNQNLEFAFPSHPLV